MKPSKSFSSRYHQALIRSYMIRGAVVIDVRTKGEWDRGHIVNSLHIDLNTIPYQIHTLKALNSPIIVVCLGGSRSEQARKYLLEKGMDVINGGPWQNLNSWLQTSVLVAK